MKKLLSLLLIAIMSLSFVGCGEKKEAATPKANESTESNANSGEAKNGDDSPVVLDTFINHTWYTNEDFTGRIPEKITELTGVTLNVTKAADETQLGLMIASGELPDLIFTSKELSRLSNPDVSYAWNELIDKGYMPMFDQGEERIINAKSFSPDDNFYTILSAYGTKDDWNNSPTALLGGPGLIMRQDIYEEVGSPALDTVEDFRELLKTVKGKYPEMRPFIFNPIWKMTPFKVAFGAQSDGRYSYYYDNNGSIEYGIRSEGYIDFLKYANSLYREGLLTADNFAIKNESDVNGEFYGGRAFAMTWTAGALGGVQPKLQQNYPEASAALVTGLETPHDPVLLNNTIGWSGVFISKNTKNVEAAAKVVDFLYSKEGRELTCYGIEGEDWTRGADGQVTLSDAMIDMRLNNPNKWESEWNKGFYFGKQLEENIAGGILFNQVDSDINKMIIESSDYYKEIVDINPLLKIIEPKADTDERVIFDKLTKLIDEEEAKIIMSSSDEELMENYNQLIKIATKLGMEKLEAQLTEQYKALK